MLSVIVVDDKPLAIDMLRGYLQKIPFAAMKAGFTNPLEAIDYIETHPTDLVLLDIQMPEITGVQLMKITGAKTKFILVTAYPDYAVEGFEYNAVDYLLKPVSFERFYIAMEKAKTLLESSAADTPNIMQRDFIFLKTERRIRKLDHQEILYIEARQNYIFVHLAGEKLMVLQTMKQTEEMLPSGFFCRIHKSYIVNLSAIQSVEQHVVYIGGAGIPVGEAYRQGFYRVIGQ